MLVRLTTQPETQRRYVLRTGGRGFVAARELQRSSLRQRTYRDRT
ncbi:hypothetical protein [Merismopedia glauca]|nr:hypothetical protein [Merismopedia glauca]